MSEQFLVYEYTEYDYARSDKTVPCIQAHTEIT